MPGIDFRETRQGGLEVAKMRSEFPMLSKTVNGKPQIYLDNAATTHKPWSVIHRMLKFDTDEYATVHRGAYKLGEKATENYEQTRQKVADFIGAGDSAQIVFTSGATQGINLVASSFGGKFVHAGDEVIISHIEHHANILPWQTLCDAKGATLKIIPVDDKGDLIMEEFEKLLSDKTKVVAVTHVSNALGTVNPVKEIVAKAHEAGAVILIDGAQSVPHMKIDVTDLDCDFFVFSGHKMYGPSGVGILYGKKHILDSMPPYVTGGEMIKRVTFEKSSFADVPYKFEAGTPPISQVIGLGAAIDFLNDAGMDRIAEYELELMRYGEKLLRNIDGLRLIGEAREKAGILSFTLEMVHPHDVVTLLSDQGIAIRGGHHCAQPTMQRFGVPATARASVSFYNTFEDMDALADGIRNVIKVFS